MIDKKHINATRVVATTFCVLVGLAGIDHGIFEILQGNNPPGKILIEAIGPAPRFWEFGTEPAVTIIPSYMVSGILTTVIGILVIIWSVFFIDRKHGAGTLMLLCILLFVTGEASRPFSWQSLAAWQHLRSTNRKHSGTGCCPNPCSGFCQEYGWVL